MKKSRFTEEQIIYALRLADSGKAVVDVPADRRIGGHVLHVEEEIRRSGCKRAAQAQADEDENAMLRRIVGDLTLDKQILQEVL